MDLLPRFLRRQATPDPHQTAVYLAYSALDNLQDAIIVTDPAYKVVYTNLSARQLLPSLEDQMIGQSITQIYRGGLAQYQAAWEEQLARPLAASVTNVQLGDDRRHVTEDLRVSRLHGDLGLAFILRDVTALKQSNDTAQAQTARLEETNKQLTDSKRAMLNLLEDARDLETQLKRQKSGVEHKVQEQTHEIQSAQVRLEASINSINVGFIMTDAKRSIMTINHAAKAILSHDFKRPPRTWSLAKLQEALGQDIDLTAKIDQCYATHKPISEPKLTHNDRILRLYLAPISEHQKAESEVLGVVILVEDITEVVAGERSRDEFFSIASHELRTPLTAIRGNTQMIQTYFGDQLKDPQLVEMIADIHESSIRLITLVNDFLDSSRLEQGKIKFTLAPVNLAEVLQAVIKEYQAAGMSPGLYLKLTPPPKGVAAAYADHDRLKQVLINLVGNAMKFTEHGGVTIKVSQGPEALFIDVTDTGKGIPADSTFLLFRKFQQASNNILTRDSTRSSGLGLYISRLIMNGMDGQVELYESEEGKGSTFRVTVPLVADKVEVKV
jgi:signal transduction histidine kinase